VMVKMMMRMGRVKQDVRRESGRDADRYRNQASHHITAMKQTQTRPPIIFPAARSPSPSGDDRSNNAQTHIPSTVHPCLLPGPESQLQPCPQTARPQFLCSRKR
jgi:hypothetical protein